MYYGYALAPYGFEPYGNPYIPTTLLSTTPVAGAVNVAPMTPISFVLQAFLRFDSTSLNVDVAGQHAIVGSVFQAGYAGTISFNGAFCVVTINTHPILPVSTTVHIDVKNYGEVEAVFDFSFTCKIVTPVIPRPSGGGGGGGIYEQEQEEEWVDELEQDESSEDDELSSVLIKVSQATVILKVYVPPIDVRISEEMLVTTTESKADIVCKIRKHR